MHMMALVSLGIETRTAKRRSSAACPCISNNVKGTKNLCDAYKTWFELYQCSPQVIMSYYCPALKDQTVVSL